MSMATSSSTMRKPDSITTPSSCRISQARRALSSLTVVVRVRPRREPIVPRITVLTRAVLKLDASQRSTVDVALTLQYNFGLCRQVQTLQQQTLQMLCHRARPASGRLRQDDAVVVMMNNN